MCWSAQQEFDSDAQTPSAARRFVVAQLPNVLTAELAAALIGDVELVVSELVTNSVRAGAGSVLVGVQVHHGEVALDVDDDAPGWPRLGHPGERETSGRGLLLVDALADHWLAEPKDGGGKRVRVTMVIPAQMTRTLTCDRPTQEAATPGR